ncbi:MAG TPA: hypothetical protein VF666_02770 [Pyrinomonadaceae bacterium]|jgi:uncharacterized protein (DUF983 family)
MANIGARKIFFILMVAAGIVLLGMYAILKVNGGRPSSGMLVVGVVDLVVGLVLLRRLKEGVGSKK